MNNSTSSRSISDPRLITEEEFAWLSRYLYDNTGIVLKNGKQALVVGRLDKRLRFFNLDTYGEYFRLINQAENTIERQMMIDLLTTNETYFFREPKHFDFLRSSLLPHHPRHKMLRVWSAASSSGEEAYTLAMTLAETLANNLWEIVGTDISSRILEKAASGFYPMAAAEKIPLPLLKKYCLKGRDAYDGFFRIDASLRNRVNFKYANLIEPLPNLGRFDVIFLRNVMIYFDTPTKQQIVSRIKDLLQPGGYFFVSHSETLNGLNSELKLIAPSMYRRGA